MLQAAKIYLDRPLLLLRVMDYITDYSSNQVFIQISRAIDAVLNGMERHRSITWLQRSANSFLISMCQHQKILLGPVIKDRIAAILLSRSAVGNVFFMYSIIYKWKPPYDLVTNQSYYSS